MKINLNRGSRKNRPAAVAVAALAGLLGVAGCLDQPLPSPEPVDKAPAEIVAGPYADGSGPYARDRVTLRFSTNRAAVPGVRRRESSVKIVERTGVAATNQRITVSFLQQDATDPVQMMLNNLPGPELKLRGVADVGQPAKILFTERQPRWDRFGWRMVEELPDGVVFLAPPLPADDAPPRGLYADDAPNDAPAPSRRDAAAAQREFLAPLGAAAWSTPLHFVPGAARGLDARLFPESLSEGDGGVWARDVGAVRLVGFDVRAMAEPSTRAAVLTRIHRVCQALPAGVRWRVGVASVPVVDRAGANAAPAHSASDELERAGLDLVVCGGGRGGYARTALFTGGRGGATRYVAFSPPASAFGDVVFDPANAAAEADAPYLAARGQAHAGLLEADYQRLLWTVAAEDGSIVDRLEIFAGRPADEPVRARAELSAEAAALVSQRAELDRVLRQLARRVPNPGAPLTLPLLVENATDRPMELRFAWDQDNGGGGHSIAPPAAELRLEPWQGGQIPFGVSPAAGGRPRRLTIDAGRAGRVSGDLVLRREEWYAVPFSPTPAIVNGRLNEEAWNGLRTSPVTDFVRLADGASPARAVRAAVAADARGLLVAFHCVVDNPLGMPARAERPQEDHDSPDVARDESVEIWVDPSRAGRDWYRFAANIRKSRLEANSRAGATWSPEWEMNSRGADRNKAVEYEIRLPWKIFGLDGPPPAGTEWALNLVRNDIEPMRGKLAEGDPSATAEPYTWARVEGSLDNSGLYNIIRFTRQAP